MEIVKTFIVSKSAHNGPHHYYENIKVHLLSDGTYMQEIISGGQMVLEKFPAEKFEIMQKNPLG